MTPAPSDAAGAFCAAEVRNHDFERYASTLFLPPDARRALLALYAFNVEIVRIRDQVSQPLPGEIRMQWWTDMLAGAGHGDVADNPVVAELLAAIGKYDLPAEQLVRLVDEHQFDLYNDPMPAIADLDGYLGNTAGTMFALAARVLGHSSNEIDHLAHHAGVACGIARLIATFPADAARRQLYLPLEICVANGSSADEVFAGKSTPAIRKALDQVIALAREHLDLALELLADSPTMVRPAFLPLATARRNLDRAAQPDFDFLALHVNSRLRTLWTLWRAARAAPFKT